MQRPHWGDKYPSMISLLVDLGAQQSRSLTVIPNCGSHAQCHLPLPLTRENEEYKAKRDGQIWLRRGQEITTSPNGPSLMADTGGAVSRGLQQH